MAKPTGKEMVQIMKEQENPIELASEMDRFINNFTADLTGFIDALKEAEQAVQIRFATICLLWVKKMDMYFEGKWFDLRNEYSVETAHQIKTLLGNTLTSFQPDYQGAVERNSEEDLSFEAEFVEKLGRTHRTLQQTFSGLVFHWLVVMQETIDDSFFEQVSRQLSESLERDVHRTPMI